MKVVVLLGLILCALGCSRAPSTIVVSESISWQILGEQDSKVTGRGSSTLTFSNATSQTMSVALAGGPLSYLQDSRGWSSSAKIEVFAPIPEEVSRLFPCEFQAGQAISATFPSGGRAARGRQQKVKVALQIAGVAVEIEGPVEFEFK
ncbi:MAG: hypothetical protein IPK15_22265 [Verrucomicrobia bacterium]|nr:hypothetical protein [Verrucomicrobiota bacterium]